MDMTGNQRNRITGTSRIIWGYNCSRTRLAGVCALIDDAAFEYDGIAGMESNVCSAGGVNVAGSVLPRRSGRGAAVSIIPTGEVYVVSWTVCRWFWIDRNGH